MNTMRFAALGLAAGLLAGLAPRAGAQAPQTDPRWQAWLGCWTPVAAKERDSGNTPARALLVCVVPSSGGSGVDVATVADSQVVSRDRIDATGQRLLVEREGCSGWESAQWSAAGAEVYLRSELTCQGNLRRRSNGVMALSPDGEWLDVRAVTAGSRRGVRVLRYEAAPLPENLPADIASALRAAGGARVAVPAGRADLTTADIADASRQLDADVVQAWLVESGQAFHMNAPRLLEAKRAGIPGDVIDVMVALSYPRVFAINPASHQAEAPVATEAPRAASGYSYAGPYGSYGWGGYYYSPYGWDSWWPYGWNPYSPFYSPYGVYGYSPWYGGYGGWYGGWYYGGGGGVLIVDGNSGSAVQHGQVVKGRGYVQGGTDSGRDARPRGSSPSARPQGRASRDGGYQPSSGGSSGGSRSSGSASSGSSSGSSSSGSSSSGSSGRTAKARPPR